MTASTTIRVRPHTREAIARLSRQRGVSTAALLDAIVSREQDEELLAGMNEDFRRLRHDPAATEEMRSEREAWDRTLLDGLSAP